MRNAIAISIAVLAAGAAVGIALSLRAQSSPVLACSPSKNTFDEYVRDASLVAIVRLVDPDPSPTATPSARVTATRTPAPQFSRTTMAEGTHVSASATFAAIVSAFATKTPFVGTAEPIIERIIADRNPDSVPLSVDAQRLGEVLANQRNDFGCGAKNGGFDYAFGNRYLVFLRGQPDEKPHYGNVFPLNERDELEFSVRVSRALYDAFFSDRAGSFTDAPGFVSLYSSKISLDRLEPAIHAIQSGAIRPPDTGSAGLASPRH